MILLLLSGLVRLERVAEKLTRASLAAFGESMWTRRLKSVVFWLDNVIDFTSDVFIEKIFV